MMNRAIRFLPFLFLISAASCRSPDGHGLDSPSAADRQKAKATPLEGKWEVFSAGYQTSGKICYTFEGDTLTIETHFREGDVKVVDAPVSVSISRWTIEIDDTKSPHRLIMKRIAEPSSSSITKVEAFELRDGELRMCSDVGQRITSDSLRLSNGATGLSRIE